MKRLSIFAPIIFFWGLFIFTVFQVPYPQSLIGAKAYQILPFFISLIFSIAFTLNIFFKNIFISFSISLGLMSLLILKAIDSLSIVITILIITAVLLLISYFRKDKSKNLNPIKSDLTKLYKIPKLTRLKKEN